MSDAIGFTREDMAQEEREFFREHDKQIRAEVINEFVRINKECQQSDKCQNKECVECIAEELKEKINE